LVLGVIFCSVQAAAQDEPAEVRASPGPAAAAPGAGPGSPLEQYRAQALGTRYSFWKGLKVVRQGQEVDPGFFGGDAELFFGSSPSAMESMDSYRAMRIAGTTLWAAGLAVLVTQLILVATHSELFIRSSAEGGGIKPAFWGMLIPAAVAGITGGMLMQGANGYLSDAIQHHNDDLAARLGGGRAAFGRGLGLAYRGQF
jgi:hypothetical protein